jgi:hypothetical protein
MDLTEVTQLYSSMILGGNNCLKVVQEPEKAMHPPRCNAHQGDKQLTDVQEMLQALQAITSGRLLFL